MTPTPEQFAALVQAYGNAVLNMAWENESVKKKKAAMGRADAAKAIVLDAYAQAVAERDELNRDCDVAMRAAQAWRVRHAAAVRAGGAVKVPDCAEKRCQSEVTHCDGACHGVNPDGTPTKPREFWIDEKMIAWNQYREDDIHVREVLPAITKAQAESSIDYWQQRGHIEIGDPCPTCATGKIGQSGGNLRCSNCGFLGRSVTHQEVYAMQQRRLAHPPAEAATDEARVREALQFIARQKLAAEMPEEDRIDADYESGYEAVVRTARAALQEHKK